jgi:hypothetical protein
MEPDFGGFRVSGLGAEHFTGIAEPVDPRRIFRTELLFEFFAETLGQGWALAVGGDGDLELAALDYGAAVEVAMVDVVHGVAKDVTLVSFFEDGGVDLGERSGSDDEEFAVEVSAFKWFREPINFAVAGPFHELGDELGGHDGNVSTGLEEAGDLGGGDGAATYDQDGSVVEFEKCRE